MTTDPPVRRIYLAGPINGRSDADAKDWRRVAIAALTAAGHAVLNPMDRDYRGQELDPGIAALIVEQDKADIATCTDLIVLYDRPSVGTSMEILYAHDRGLGIHLVNVSAGPLSPWLTYHATAVHPTLAGALAAIGTAAPHHAGDPPAPGTREAAFRCRVRGREVDAVLVETRDPEGRVSSLEFLVPAERRCDLVHWIGDQQELDLGRVQPGVTLDVGAEPYTRVHVLRAGTP